MQNNIDKLYTFLRTRAITSEWKIFSSIYKIAASKKKILVGKIGLSDSHADKLDDLFGPRSVFIANKLLSSESLQIFKTQQSKVDAINDLSFNNIETRYHLVQIRDYILVALNGDISSLKELSIEDIENAAIEWHESLEASGSEINYVENNEIVLDFRDKDGIGFYWANLNTNSSAEESDRMGHCGTSGYGNTLFSLREYSKADAGNYTLNQSHLTFAISNDKGIVVQAKGRKNSKPSSIYHKYIIELLKLKVGNDFLINGFKSEYMSDNDFSISDLSDEDKDSFDYINPSILKGTSEGLSYLLSKNKISKEEYDSKFIINFELNKNNMDTIFPSSYTHGNDVIDDLFSQRVPMPDYSFGDIEHFLYSKSVRDLISNVCIEALLKNGEDKEFVDSLSPIELVKSADDYIPISMIIVMAINKAYEYELFNIAQQIILDGVRQYTSIYDEDFNPDEFTVSMKIDIRKHVRNKSDIDLILAEEDDGEKIEILNEAISTTIRPLRFDKLEEVYPNEDIFYKQLVDNIKDIDSFR